MDEVLKDGIQINSINEEGTESEEFEEISTPYDVSKIDIHYEPEYVDRLVRKYKLRELNLNPDFQRNEVWKIRQKSRLIESLLIKIPIPSFYIDARDESNWIVIDGLQRLSTIIRFINDEFSLKDLEFLQKLDGKKFSELGRNFQRRIEDCKLSLYLIRPNTPEEIALNIYTRINTLGVPLSQQEIRHAIYGGKSTELLKTLSDSVEFLQAVNPTQAMKRRMNDRELILRFLAFNIFDYSKYKTSNNLTILLANTMKKINKMDLPQIEKLSINFKDSMIKATIVFGKYAFRKIFINDTTIRPINKPLFETFGYFLPMFESSKLKKAKKSIIRKLKYELTKNAEFEKSVSRATNNVLSVQYRFRKVKKIIENSIREL